MWLEVKSVITVVTMFLIIIVLGYIMPVNMFLGFLLLMAMFSLIFGDILIGWRIASTRANYWIDPPKAEHELGVLLTSTGLLDLVITKKAPLGKREFIYHKKEASVINNGDDNFHTRSGTPGFFMVEGYDQNINVHNAKAMSEFEGRDVKEIYGKAKGLKRWLHGPSEKTDERR